MSDIDKLKAEERAAWAAFMETTEAAREANSRWVKADRALRAERKKA